MEGMENLLRVTLRDIEVELLDEFDKNFERQGFFSEAWQRRKSPTRPGGHILLATGRLRRSLHSKTTADSITFLSTEPYASLHNEGGEIVVTARMKKYFWHKYYEARGSFGRKKDGSLRNDKRTLRLSDEAEFWKRMALQKCGSKMRIPRRRFLGWSPEVERAVTSILEENVRDYADVQINHIIEKSKQ